MRQIQRAVAVLSLTLFMGCAILGGGGWQTAGGKFLTSTALTVDAAMHGWATWVASGKATSAEEANVKGIYQHYEGVMMLATNAYVLAVKINDPTVFDAPSNNLFIARSAVVAGATKAN